jgi:hypothetical protein
MTNTLRIWLSALMVVVSLTLVYLNIWHKKTPIWMSVVFLVLALGLLFVVMPNP